MTSDYSVDDTASGKDVFYRARLRVGTVEDRVVGKFRSTLDVFKYLIGNVSRLVVFVHGGMKGYFFALAEIGPKIFTLSAYVICDNGVGGVEDVSGRAVVLLKLNNYRIGVFHFEVKDIFDSSAAETVDRLIVVSYDADVAVNACEKLAKLILRVVGILILVDHYVAELVGIVFEDVGFLFKKLYGV